MRLHAFILTLVAAALCSVPLAQVNPITNPSFEQTDPNGAPTDWETMGTFRLVPDAHSGKVALLLDRAPGEKGETGLNRAWTINSGERGAMLAELKGGIEFWYKAPKADADTKLRVYVIPMTSAPLEGTGAPRATFEVPRAYIGDGQWHRGLLKYDYTGSASAKWVHISARIEGGAGQILLDDFRWLTQVGPLPGIRKLKLTEVAGKEGEACTITADVTNAGDAPMQAVPITLQLPAYLKADAPLRREVPATQPDEVTQVSWKVTGERSREDVIVATMGAGDQVSEARIALAPDLQVEQLKVLDFVVEPGQRTRADLIVRNNGNAVARNVLAELENTPDAQLAVRDVKPRTIGLIRPGQMGSATWWAQLDKETPSCVLTATAAMTGKIVGKASVELICAASAARPDLAAEGDGAVAAATDAGAVVGNSQVRLLFGANRGGGFGPGRLFVRSGNSWAYAGVIPSLGAVATAPASEGKSAERARITHMQAETKGGLATLHATGTTVGGIAFAWTLNCRRGWDYIEYRLLATPNEDTAIYGLEGPMLYARDFAFSGQRPREAMFPGLEWLVGDEVSSSTLDISASLPMRYRWCPPPHAVTIPAMSVNSGGITVGLLWDHLQKYYRDDTRPRAVFASPDRFEGRGGTLMGLMTPGGADPEWWIPPRKATEKPWQVTAGQAITLHAQLYAKGDAKDALTAMDRWFALNGAPEPERLPHGKDWRDEISFSAIGYLDSLWDPKTSKWFQSINGPNTMTSQGWHVPYLYDTIRVSQLASDPAIRERAAARADEVRRLGAAPAAADDLGFEFGNAIASVVGHGEMVMGIIRGQEDDGSWRFRARIEKSGVFAGMDYSEIGPDRAAEVGTCANNAHQVLQYARMTGDPTATAAGLKALKFMDRFTVPRAAQVWEVPVHTPDVLASADACEAYLEGYFITGDKHCLDKAVFWARTGLPFIYMWDIPNYEMLRYASIPVMGASWYACNWFGQPVQWNGLRLATAYSRLAAFDRSYPWQRIAEGITVSAMWQQHDGRPDAEFADRWPDTSAKYTGLWPDNFNSIDKLRCPWVFAPQQILGNVYRFMGLHPDPETVSVEQGGGAIEVSACAAIETPKIDRDTLAATLHLTPPQTSQVVLCNVAKPSAVRVNGAVVPETNNLADATGPAWQYGGAWKILAVKPGAEKDVRLEVVGTRYERGSAAPPVARKVSFHFDSDDGGWRAMHDLTMPIMRNRSLYTQVTGDDPYLVRTGMDLQPDSCTVIRVRMSVGIGGLGPGQLFWATADSPDFDEAKSIHFPIVADGQMHEYAIKVCDSNLWVGHRITALRIDPCNGPRNTDVSVDYVMGNP
jgi:hypothetical protein